MKYIFIMVFVIGLNANAFLSSRPDKLYLKSSGSTDSKVWVIDISKGYSSVKFEVGKKSCTLELISKGEKLRLGCQVHGSITVGYTAQLRLDMTEVASFTIPISSVSSKSFILSTKP